MACEGLAAVNTKWYPLSWWKGGWKCPLEHQEGGEGTPLKDSKLGALGIERLLVGLVCSLLNGEQTFAVLELSESRCVCLSFSDVKQEWIMLEWTLSWCVCLCLLSGIARNFTQEPTGLRAYVGGSARFDCSIKATPPAAIVWQKDNAQLTIDDYR